MSPYAVRGTGTHHTAEPVKRGRERGGRGTARAMSCHTKAIIIKHQKKMPPICNATVHKHMELRHMCVCVNIAGYQGTQVLLVANSIKLYLTAFIYDFKPMTKRLQWHIQCFQQDLAPTRAVAGTFLRITAVFLHVPLREKGPWGPFHQLRQVLAKGRHLPVLQILLI